MKRRWVSHVIFWSAYWIIYAYTYSRYDGAFGKYLLTEGLEMPARMLATYAGFWCLERFSKPGKTWFALGGLVVCTIGGGLLNRLLKLHYIVPVYFPTSTIVFFDWRMMFDIFDCALASGTALSARLFFRQQDSLRREERLQREKTEVELQALKSQLHPHFLFNTINNIYALARMKSEKTAEVALQLAHLLRFVLYETRKPAIPLAQELRILQDYLALEQLRFDEDRLQVNSRFDLDDPQQHIAPLLLLPLIENAFKHGVSEHRTDAWVRISVVLKNQQLRVEVENSVDTDGIPDQPSGIGLHNLRRQLELLYPGKSQLTATLIPTSTVTGTAHYLAQLAIQFS